jgi:pyrimidine operon attenuation protein/uracil phosphoribosyltransferase
VDTLHDAASVQRLVQGLARDIVAGSETGRSGPLCLVGIHTGGVPLARRIAAEIGALTGNAPRVGETDITLYRDDLYTGLEKPSLGLTRLPFSVDGSRIVLVDDVLFTGRTVRAALGLLMDYGRPAWIKLAVLVDRGHRELPVAADFVGCTIETQLADRVTVQFTEAGAIEDAICVEGRSEPR